MIKPIRQCIIMLPKNPKVIGIVKININIIRGLNMKSMIGNKNIKVTKIIEIDNFKNQDKEVKFPIILKIKASMTNLILVIVLALDQSNK